MNFLEWILNKLRNNEPLDEEDFERIPLRIEKEPPPPPPKRDKEDKKEDKRVVIIDI